MSESIPVTFNGDEVGHGTISEDGSIQFTVTSPILLKKIELGLTEGVSINTSFGPS